MDSFYTLEWLQETESTNSEALTRAHNGAPAWTVIASDQQTAGRGRLKRSWHSPHKSGLYFSVVLRPHLAPENLPLITLATGIAVCQGVEDISGLTTSIKWPNDIFINGRKVGGILSESEITGRDNATVIIGIGINVSMPEASFPLEISPKATSLLLASGTIYSRKKILAAIMPHLQKMVLMLEEERLEQVLNSWKKRDALLGEALTWVTVAGEKVTGIALGIDAHGLYHIRDRAGVTHQVLSGDITTATPG